MTAFSWQIMADEAELEVQGKRALLQRRRELAGKGKWPNEQLERLEYQIGVFADIARVLRKQAEKVAAQGGGEAA